MGFRVLVLIVMVTTSALPFTFSEESGRSPFRPALRSEEAQALRHGLTLLLARRADGQTPDMHQPEMRRPEMRRPEVRRPEVRQPEFAESPVGQKRWDAYDCIQFCMRPEMRHTYAQCLSICT
uniref:Conotoxin flf14c n=1 Tax=Conus anabathrum floridanus TaxID=1520082 RepID=CREC_CONAW